MRQNLTPPFVVDACVKLRVNRLMTKERVSLSGMYDFVYVSQSSLMYALFSEVCNHNRFYKKSVSFLVTGQTWLFEKCIIVTKALFWGLPFIWSDVVTFTIITHERLEQC